ncbi:MAG: response regulator [Gammaproteobacteria bacterium]|nr:response regulator [Gammaproteobacteria bacterium]
MQGTVHVVDDDKSVRTALTRLLSVSGFRVRTYEGGQQLLDVGFNERDTEPSCILLDLQMSGLDGLTTFEKLAASHHPPVIFVTAHGDVHACATVMKHGAFDFLEKPVGAARLTLVVDKALTLCAAEQDARLTLDGYRRRIGLLTPREQEVMRHIISGRLNKVIGRDLAISEKTVKVHRARVLGKMRVKSVAELTRICTIVGLEPAETEAYQSWAAASA